MRINEFVKIIHKERYCSTVVEAMHSKIEFFQIVCVIGAASPAGQYMLQGFKKIKIMNHVGIRWFGGIVKTHSVEGMPQARPPYGGHHAIVAIIMLCSEANVIHLY